MGAGEQQHEEYAKLVNENLDHVEQGEAAYEFLHNTAIGRYLIESAVEVQEEAFKEWQGVDPTDAIAIQACQHRASAPSLVIAFLADAITRGKAASEVIAAELEGMSDEE